MATSSPTAAREQRREAFSLIELLILVTAALVIAGLSVPVLRGISLSSNTDSAIETMLRIRDFQIRYFEKGLSTRRGGGARFGTFDELLKSGLSLEDSSTRHEGLVLVRHGYLFQCYYATKAGDPVADPRDESTDPVKDRFVVYAWPVERGRSGVSAFVADPSGLLRFPAVQGVLECKNLLLAYSGLGNPPKWSAARSATYARDRADSGAATATAAAASLNPANLLSHRGEDGEMWEALPMSR